MIDVTNLTKSFGPRQALAGVDLHVDPGEFVVLVGPNGAGKTTLLRILATLSRPSSGNVSIAGLDLAQAGSAARQHIGFLSHRTLLYDDLTAEISRRHNDLNVLCLSGDILGERAIDRLIKIWLNTDFEGGRHARRVDKISHLEQRNGKS